MGDGESALGTLRAPDGKRLSFRAWRMPEARAALLVVPGLGEHAGRYAALAGDLAQRGVSVYAIDLRGHGLSGGVRGHCRRFDDFLGDVRTLHQHLVHSLDPDVPIFLLGHSFGGLVALRYLESGPAWSIRGGVISAPLIEAAVAVPAWKRRLAGLLSRVAPTFPFSNEVDAALLSHDETAVDAYRLDPLVHSRITPRLYTEILAAARAAAEDADRLRLPLLFLVPSDDRIVRSDATLRLAGRIPATPEVRVYEGLYHEALNELERERVIDDLAAWLDARLA